MIIIVLNLSFIYQISLVSHIDNFIISRRTSVMNKKKNQEKLIFVLIKSLGSVSIITRQTNYYASENISLPTEHKGHAKSSGRSSNAVPGSMPASGEPTSGSYSQPHTSHTYFFIIVLCLSVSNSLFLMLQRYDINFRLWILCLLKNTKCIFFIFCIHFSTNHHCIHVMRIIIFWQMV